MPQEGERESAVPAQCKAEFGFREFVAMGATMNSRAVSTIIGIGVLCSCTNQAPPAIDPAVEQSALTAAVLEREDVSALKAVMFGVGHGPLVDQYWDHASVLVRNDPSYGDLVDLVVAELVRRDPDLVGDFNDAIKSGSARRIRREIERAQDCLSDILGGRNNPFGSVKVLTRGGSGDLGAVQTLTRGGGTIDLGNDVQVLIRH